jgi:DNA polymerase III epsilon subunit-like protein
LLSNKIPEKAGMRVTGLDIETGGLNPQTNGIISIGIIAPNKKEFYQIVKPNLKLRYEKSALQVNKFQLEKQKKELGWTHPNLTKSETPPPCLPEDIVLENMIQFLEEHCQNSFITGCNIAHDKAFLLEAAKRVDQKNLKKTKNAAGNPKKTSAFFVLDKKFLHRTYELQTIALFLHHIGINPLTPNKYNPKIPSISLDNIAKSIGLQRNPPNNHDALEDCRLTLQTLKKLKDLTLHNHTEKKQPLQKIENQTQYEKLIEHLKNPKSHPTPNFLKKNGYIKKTIYKKFTSEQKKALLPLLNKPTKNA